MSEIIFLVLLALVVIGPKELPELARTIGRFLNELKRTTNVLGDELKQQVRIDRRAMFDENKSDFTAASGTETVKSPNAENQKAEDQKNS